MTRYLLQEKEGGRDGGFMEGVLSSWGGLDMWEWRQISERGIGQAALAMALERWMFSKYEVGECRFSQKSDSCCRVCQWTAECFRFCVFCIFITLIVCKDRRPTSVVFDAGACRRRRQRVASNTEFVC